jgi:hypothetical protein
MYGAKDGCVACDEQITNPLCAACLGDGIVQWLRERSHSELATDVRALTGQVAISAARKHRKHFRHGPIWCVACGAGMKLCTYCYTRDVFDLIKREQSLVSEFLRFWNFDLDHMGWEQEASAYAD